LKSAFTCKGTERLPAVLLQYVREV